MARKSVSGVFLPLVSASFPLSFLPRAFPYCASSYLSWKSPLTFHLSPGSTDVAVPFSRLADIIEVSKKEMDDLGLFASILGHIGDGNFHESIIYNRRSKEELEKVETCVKNMVKRAINMEGTCTGEHSIGWGKKESLFWEVGSDTLDVMKAIKKSLDPLWIMNPGKIMDVPWMHEEYSKDHGVLPIRNVQPSEAHAQSNAVPAKEKPKDWAVGLGGVVMHATKD